MSAERSRDAAWEVIDQLWHERRRSSDSASDLTRSVGSDQVHVLFDLFWQNQFEDDRAKVQQKASKWIDLIITDGQRCDEA